jgi:hypothetical protein
MGDEELWNYLELDQLVTDKARPVPRRVFSPKADAGLWLLRVFAVVLTAMVVYTFVVQIT